ncbi:MAG: DUF456 domain-containing protein [Pseudoxanthomonas suwonensis]|nr:DUF456 domain-containing protein [Pseudoxanthomonas suwonensis]
MDHATLLFALAGILVLIGLAGLVLPALPGLPLVFAGLLLAAWADGFQNVHWAWMVPLGILTLLSFAIDLWATAMGAKRVGASRLAIIGSVAGTFAGLFFGLPGLVVGPFAGALGGELLHRRRLHGQDIGHAAKVGVGTWFGIVFGIALKLALAFGMIGVFALVWWL